MTNDESRIDSYRAAAEDRWQDSQDTDEDDTDDDFCPDCGEKYERYSVANGDGTYYRVEDCACEFCADCHELMPAGSTETYCPECAADTPADDAPAPNAAINQADFDDFRHEFAVLTGKPYRNLDATSREDVAAVHKAQKRVAEKKAGALIADTYSRHDRATEDDAPECGVCNDTGAYYDSIDGAQKYCGACGMGVVLRLRDDREMWKDDAPDCERCDDTGEYLGDGLHYDETMICTCQAGKDLTRERNLVRFLASPVMRKRITDEDRDWLAARGIVKNENRVSLDNGNSAYQNEMSHKKGQLR